MRRPRSGISHHNLSLEDRNEIPTRPYEGPGCAGSDDRGCHSRLQQWIHRRPDSNRNSHNSSSANTCSHGHGASDGHIRTTDSDTCANLNTNANSASYRNADPGA